MGPLDRISRIFGISFQHIRYLSGADPTALTNKDILFVTGTFPDSGKQRDRLGNQWNITVLMGLCMLYTFTQEIAYALKSLKNRAKNRKKLGIDRRTAYRVAYTGKRITYLCNKGTVKKAINNKRD